MKKTSFLIMSFVRNVREFFIINAFKTLFVLLVLQIQSNNFLFSTNSMIARIQILVVALNGFKVLKIIPFSNNNKSKQNLGQLVKIC